MIDLNCDLGEGEALSKTRALMRHVTSANIACGGHAGDADTMRNCLRLCKELGVRPGAHPGLPDRENFGRKEMPMAEVEFRTLLVHQIGGLALIARRKNLALTHIKLHGALYHMVENSIALAREYVNFVSGNLPGVEIYGSPAGYVARQAKKHGVIFRGEIYADRAYTSQGRLAARTIPGAVLGDLDLIQARIEAWQKNGRIIAMDGTELKLPGSTICIHSDSVDSVRIAKRIAQR